MNCQKCFIQSVLFIIWSFVTIGKLDWSVLHKLGKGRAQWEYGQVWRLQSLSQALSTAPPCVGGCKCLVNFCIRFFSLSPACISLLWIKYSNMHWRWGGSMALGAVTPEHQGTVCSPVAPSHRFFHHLALPGRGIQVLLKHKAFFAWWPKTHGSRKLLSNLCNFYIFFP